MRLVFANALAYNPPANPVHRAARALATEFEGELRRTLERLERSAARVNEHSCSLCQVILIITLRCQAYVRPPARNESARETRVATT